jgi:hypothetical protein
MFSFEDKGLPNLNMEKIFWGGGWGERFYMSEIKQI